MRHQQTPTAFPLAWPNGWPKTEDYKKQDGSFKTETPRALANLKRELDLMRAKNLVLSSNYTLGVENPKDSGVVAYFEWEQTQMAIPCDRYRRIAHNIQAIALTIEAMRGIERWGAKHMIKAMFSGFKQIGMGQHHEEPLLKWWEILKCPHESNGATITEAYRRRIKEVHPDKGGTQEEFINVQAAYDHVKSLGYVQ